MCVKIEYIYFELNHLLTLSFTASCLIVFLALMRNVYDNYSETFLFIIPPNKVEACTTNWDATSE